MTARVEINTKETPGLPGQTLFEHAETVDVRVPTSCLKQGKCRECMVEVVEGMELLSEPAPEEKHLRDRFRLACRARLIEGEGSLRCHTMRRAAMRIEESATENLGTEFKLDPAVTRDGDRVLLDGEEIVRSTGPLHGVAIDLGTTTVVLRLMDLETGEILASQSFENPQRFAGSDIMARIHFDSVNSGKLLQRTLLGYLSHALEAFPGNPQDIYEIAIAGNATMRDLFFGLNVYTIGQRPYRSLTEHELLDGKRNSTSLASSGKALRLPTCPSGRVYGLPLIGSHVGADAAACLLAINFLDEERTVALMDIGTNTELIVGNRNRALAASCPAGPAFEGGQLACGMPGLEGAIESVTIEADGTIRTRVIGDGVPEGICGSGLVEALGELLRTGGMNSLGRYPDDQAGRLDLDAEHGVYLEENDISELAQAKGANVAGLKIVMKNYGIDFADLDAFYLAGGFARHLSLEAASRIGLIPDLPEEKLVQVGNASIEGATVALLSKTKRTELESFVKEIKHVELETDPRFFDAFVEGCQFIPLETAQF